MIRVLFVCTGNICRSPMADAVFQQMVEDAGLANKIEVDSAGTGSWHVGERAHYGTRTVLADKNIPYEGRARQLVREDLKNFDYVLAMDDSHMRHLDSLNGSAQSAEIELFLHYAHKRGLVDVDEVPDPYYNGQFDYVYDLVNTGCQALLDEIRTAHDL